MKRIALLILCLLLILCACGKDKNSVTPDSREQTARQAALMEAYPEYFGLDASDGLDVIVWQMAPDSYSFALLKHTGASYDIASPELINLRGVRVDEIKTILSAYSVQEDDIYICPWCNPVSSYLADWQIVLDNEDAAEKERAFADTVREMLFNE